MGEKKKPFEGEGESLIKGSSALPNEVHKLCVSSS